MISRRKELEYGDTGSAEGGLYHRRFFVSRAHDLLVVRLTSPRGDKLNLRVGMREIAYEPPTDPKDHDIYQKTIDRCEDSVIGNLLTHRMFFKRRWETQPVNGCGTVARVITGRAACQRRGAAGGVIGRRDLARAGGEGLCRLALRDHQQYR